MNLWHSHLLVSLSALLLLSSCQPQTIQPSPTTAPAPSSEVDPPGEPTAEIEAAAPQDQADLIFINGSLVTMDPSRPNAQALAIKGEEIMELGTNEQILAKQGAGTRIVDLGGRAMLPGFVDAHTHLFNDHEAFGTDLLGAQDLALSNGITTLANMFSTEAFIEEMRAIALAGDLIVRTSLYLAGTDNCGVPTGDWWKEYAVSHERGERLRIAGLKIFADGGTCGKLAGSQELLEGYGLGDLFFSQTEMNDYLRAAQEGGYTLAVHAQGDRAVEQVLESFATVLGTEGNPLRHRIEHNAMVRPEQRPLYSEYDVVATLFGYFYTCDMPAWTDFFKEVGEDPRAMLDDNPSAHFAWHGDDPWLAPISPLLELASLVTRQDRREDGSFCDPPDWLLEKAISVEEGLQLMTMGSAYALFREEEVGSLTPGKFADMIVLNADPTAIDPAELWDLAPLMTLVGGDLVFCAEGMDALCAQVETEPSVSFSTNDGGPARASRSLPEAPPQGAFDGVTDDTGWVSGDDAPQWIEIDLGEMTHVIGLQLWVDQHPSGNTVHRIFGGDQPNPADELTVLEGLTRAGQLLEVDGDWAVRYLRIVTAASPSWVAWYEIKVLTD